MENHILGKGGTLTQNIHWETALFYNRMSNCRLRLTTSRVTADVKKEWRTGKETNQLTIKRD